MYEDVDLRLAEEKISNEIFSGKPVGNIVRCQPWYRRLAHKLAAQYYKARIELAQAITT